jgi:hypothetical protein
MGKNSSGGSAYSNGGVSLNGQQLAGNYYQDGNVYSNYNMTDNEKKLYDYIQSSMASGMPNINVFSDDVQKQMQSQLGAYTNQGLGLIDSMYTPMLGNLQNDIARRFGNFDNSVFMDNLKGIESQRANSMNAFAQDIMAKQNELYNDELARRYDYLNFANSMQNDLNSRIMGYLGMAGQNAAAGNTYNNSQAGYSNSGFNTSALYNNMAQMALNSVAPGSGSMLSALFK